MMDEYQKETTRLVIGVLAVGMLLFVAVSLSSCASTGHVTHTSSCPAYN